MKQCTRCKKHKDISMFGKHSKNKDGLRSRCKQCESEYNKSVRDSPSIKLSRKLAYEKYNKSNKKKLCNIKYYYSNRDRLLIKMRNQYLKSRDKILKIYCKQQDVLLKVRVRNHNYRLNKRNTSDGTVTYDSINQLMINQSYKCAICGCDLRELPSNKINLDHIYPISKGGAHSIYNLQRTCQFCNFSKGAKVTA